MSLLLIVYVGVPLVTILINGVLAYWIYTHHADVRGSQWFIATLLLAMGWMSLEVVHLLLSDPWVKFVAKTFATKFAIWSFLTTIVFFSRYSRTDFHRHVLARVTIGAVLLITVLPTFVEPFKGFIYGDVSVATEPFGYVLIEPEVGYALVGSLVAIMMAYALYVIVRYMLSTPRRSGLQLALLVVGALSVMIAIALGNLGAFPVENKTHAEFGALPQAVLVSVALFRFRLFEVKPVARNAVVENLRDPVVVLDRDLALVDYNRASTAVWPDIGEHVGRSVDAACPGLAAEIEYVDGTVQTPGQLSLVVDGQRRHYSLNVSTVGEEGSNDLYSILLRDVTDLELSRWQLATQNERLDQVAATISHDLRNPISVADGYAKMLEELLETDELDAEDAEAARGHLERVRGAHDRMGEIVDDVLTLAREGRSVEETEPIALSAVAHEAWGNVATADATLTIADDRTIDADRSRLLTLLENLYRNAVEHGGADVAVTIGPVEDGFYVTDDGPGIPDEDADAVFEYGYTTDDDGTGLGLSIVRTIAESHGWTVELDGDAGGARFVFRNVDAAAFDRDDRTARPIGNAPSSE